MDAQRKDADVGHRGWTQRLVAEFGHRSLDAKDGRIGVGMQRLDASGWTQRLGA